MTPQVIAATIVGLIGGILIGSLFRVKITTSTGDTELFHRAEVLAKNALALMADGDLSNAQYAIKQIVQLGEDN